MRFRKRLCLKSATGNHDETRGLLSNPSLESLEIYVEGQYDKYNVVYWVFFVYGVAMLLPWNVFITASEYFARRFADTPYGETFQNYFSTYFTATNLVIFALMLWRQSKSPAFQFDVMIPVVVNTTVFAIMAGTVAATWIKGEAYFWFSMFLLVLTGATTSVFQIAVFAEASRFPSRYVQAVMSGQGIAGVAVAVASILSAFAGSATKAPDEAAITRAAFLYFLCALAITVAALVGRILIAWQAFYIRQMSMEHSPSNGDVVEAEEADLDDAQRFFANDSPRSDQVSIKSVLCKSAGLVFAVAYLFVVTLAVFPSTTALIKSVERHDPRIPDVPETAAPNSNRFFDDDVFVAFHFVLFNVGDWVGRTMPILEQLRTFKSKILVVLSLARTVFIPVFLLCNVVVSDDRRLPVVFDNDLVYFLIVWLFAVSNGWLGSLLMMAAPQQRSIRSAAEKSLVGSVMSFSLVVGLAIGGASSFWVRSMV